MIYKFYDTCSLLLKTNHLFDDENSRVIISSISLQELEDIKNANNKDAEIKYSARKLLNVLNDNPEAYEIWIFKENMLKPILEKACAFDYDYNKHPDETVFVTNDLALKAIANCFFGEDSIESVNEE